MFLDNSAKTEPFLIRWKQGDDLKYCSSISPSLRTGIGEAHAVVAQLAIDLLELGLTSQPLGFSELVDRSSRIVLVELSHLFQRQQASLYGNPLRDFLTALRGDVPFNLKAISEEFTRTKRGSSWFHFHLFDRYGWEVPADDHVRGLNHLRLLFLEELDDERKTLERRKRLYDESGALFKNSRRTPIPLEIRQAVYARDGGICAECRSDTGLQYDHIIPQSKGGATTVQNIQILCEICNLKKGDKV
ncbi:MAG: HNH endonuclease [Phycisphaerales bacterium]|nr:HNH endonuclease [Phycisphaerales bacterium]